MTTDATSENEGTHKDAVAQRPQQPFIATPGKRYRYTHYLMAAILILYGGWAIYDGFVNWPNWPKTHPELKPKTAMDINFNKTLGLLLPPLGLFVLIRSLYVSRGQYRLEDDILYVPGHPPVPLKNITAADKELWDRKGIVFVDYDVSGSAKGRLKLDDYLYEREPTDQIFDEIQAALLMSPAAPAPTKPTPVAKKPTPVAAKPAPTAAPKVAPKAVTPPPPAGAPQPPPPAKPSMLNTKTPPRPKLR